VIYNSGKLNLLIESGWQQGTGTHAPFHPRTDHTAHTRQEWKESEKKLGKRKGKENWFIYPTRCCSYKSSSSALLMTATIACCSLSVRGCGLGYVLNWFVFTDQPDLNLEKINHIPSVESFNQGHSPPLSPPRLRQLTLQIMFPFPQSFPFTDRTPPHHHGLQGHMAHYLSSSKETE